jgi:hypothetical protein
MPTFRKALFALGMLSWLLGLAWADEPTSNVRFSVIRDYNGKPIRNASVVLHPVDRKGKQQRSGLQLKTDAEGNTNFDGVPYGPLRIQVLAPGFQTYGEDFDISKPDTQITIKLKRPVDQYSVYGSKPSAGTSPTAPAAPDAKSDAKPDAKPESQTDSKAETKVEVKPDPASGPPKDNPKL